MLWLKLLKRPPIKISKATQDTKNKGETSSNNKGDLKMISIHPNFVEDVRGPIDKNEFLSEDDPNFVEVLLFCLPILQRNLVVCLKSWRTKMTKLRSHTLCLARGVKR